MIRLSNGAEFPFPVLRGQDDQEVSAPCLIVYVQEGAQLEFGTLTHLVTVQLSLLFPSDESMEQTELLEKFEYACQRLVEAVYRDDLPERVNEMGEGGFHLSPPLSKWAIESQWQNRNRVVRFRAQFHATTLTLPSVPSVPQILYMAGDGTNHALHIVKKGPVYTYQVNQEDEAGEAVPFSLYRAGDGTQHKVGVQATGGIYTLFVDQADTPGEAIDSIVFAADDGTLHETSVGLSGTAVYTFQVNQHAA